MYVLLNCVLHTGYTLTSLGGTGMWWMWHKLIWHMPGMLNLPVSFALSVSFPEEGSRGAVAVGAGPRKVTISCRGIFVGGSPRVAAAAPLAMAEAASAFVSGAVEAWWGLGNKIAHPALPHLSLPPLLGSLWSHPWPPTPALPPEYHTRRCSWTHQVYTGSPAAPLPWTQPLSTYDRQLFAEIPGPTLT